MSNPFIAAGVPLRNESQEYARRTEYDAANLHTKSGELLVHLYSQITEFADTMCNADKLEQSGAAVTVYDQEFKTRLGKASNTRIWTNIDISKTTYFLPPQGVPPEEVVEELEISLSTSDQDNRLLTEKEYLLERTRCGIVYFGIYDTIEGIAQALRHEDPAFLRAFAWEEGSGYEAVDLSKRLDNLKKYRYDMAGEEKMV